MSLQCNVDKHARLASRMVYKVYTCIRSYTWPRDAPPFPPVPFVFIRPRSLPLNAACRFILLYADVSCKRGYYIVYSKSMFIRYDTSLLEYHCIYSISMFWLRNETSLLVEHHWSWSLYSASGPCRAYLRDQVCCTQRGSTAICTVAFLSPPGEPCTACVSKVKIL